MDPFTQAYNRLWEVLESRPTLTTLVGVKNRVKWTGKDRPLENRPIHADLPELSIEPTDQSGEVNLHYYQTGAMIMQGFDIGLTTGSLDIAKHLFPVKWEVFRALAHAEKQFGLEYVRNVMVTNHEETREDAAANRNRSGWHCLFTVEMMMVFDRGRDMLAGSDTL